MKKQSSETAEFHQKEEERESTKGIDKKSQNVLLNLSLWKT